MAMQLRLLCAAELYLNAEYYTDLLVHLKPKEMSLHIVVTTILSKPAADVFRQSGDITAAVEREAQQITLCQERSSLIAIPALASVIRQPIFSVYPYTVSNA